LGRWAFPSKGGIALSWVLPVSAYNSVIEYLKNSFLKGGIDESKSKPVVGR
jgi:hypothetical protein